MDDAGQNESNMQAYQLIARQYAGKTAAEDDPIMRKACRDLFIQAVKGTKILEVGCGPGVDASFLQAAGLDVTATDFSEEFVTIVRERFPQLKIQRMDMTQIDLPANSFDGLYAFASFLHLTRAQAAKTLAGFRGLLHHPGVLFMTLIRSSKLSEYVIEDWGGHPNNPLLFTCYEPKEIESLLKQAGFREVSFHQIGSKLYENLPRLIERGADLYQVLAFT